MRKGAYRRRLTRRLRRICHPSGWKSVARHGRAAGHRALTENRSQAVGSPIQLVAATPRARTSLTSEAEVDEVADHATGTEDQWSTFRHSIGPRPLPRPKIRIRHASPPYPMPWRFLLAGRRGLLDISRWRSGIDSTQAGYPHFAGRRIVCAALADDTPRRAASTDCYEFNLLSARSKRRMRWLASVSSSNASVGAISGRDPCAWVFRIPIAAPMKRNR